MFKPSKQTKSFIALMLVAFFAVMSAHYLIDFVSNSSSYTPNTASSESPSKGDRSPNDGVVNVSLDPKDWTDFSDKRRGISFKYPKAWGIKTYQEDKTNGNYIIALDPGKGSDQIRIYVSAEGFYALDGLPKEKTTVAGKQAVSVAGMILGVENNKKYYTFDLGGNVYYQPVFQKMVDQVAFIN